MVCRCVFMTFVSAFFSFFLNMLPKKSRFWGGKRGRWDIIVHEDGGEDDNDNDGDDEDIVEAWILDLSVLLYLAGILVPLYYISCGFYFAFLSSIECYNLHLWFICLIIVRIFKTDIQNLETEFKPNEQIAKNWIIFLYIYFILFICNIYLH